MLKISESKVGRKEEREGKQKIGHNFTHATLLLQIKVLPMRTRLTMMRTMKRMRR